MKRSLAPLAFISAIALVTGPTSAQTASPSPPRTTIVQSLTGGAKDAYASAQILYNNNDFAGALAKYQEAYELSKDPRVLFNMAVCERSLHAYARMQALLAQYRRDAAASISPKELADVDAALSAIRSLVGSLRLTVDVAGSGVAIDGESIGVSPLTEALVLDLGKHTVTVSKAGFDSASQAVTISGGSETAVNITLVAQRHVAQLAVTTDDAATVFVDGKVVGKGRFEGPLTPGPHELRVTESGKVPYAASVDLNDGETRTAQITLENEKHGATIWPWIVGGVVVAAGATVGGYFLFRSQPAAPPMPPDQLGSLQLTRWR